MKYMNIGRSELIQYSGIENARGELIKNFNQIEVGFNFDISDNKASIKEIIKVSAKSKIVKTKVANTYVGTSIEGQKLTGKKMLILGDIEYKIEYIANTKMEDVCTARGVIPFGGYVSLPSYIRESNGIAKTSDIEDIYSEKVCDRKIYNNIILTLRVDVF